MEKPFPWILHMEYISQGDSIFKKPGELDVEFKNNDQNWKIQKLKYDLSQCKNWSVPRSQFEPPKIEPHLTDYTYQFLSHLIKNYSDF